MAKKTKVQLERIPLALRKTDLIAFMKDSGPTTRKRIAEGTGIPPGSISTLLRGKEFVQEGHGVWTLQTEEKYPESNIKIDQSRAARRIEVTGKPKRRVALTKAQLEQELEVANGCLAMIHDEIKRLEQAAHYVLTADDLNSYPLPPSIAHALKGLRDACEETKGDKHP